MKKTNGAEKIISVILGCFLILCLLNASHIFGKAENNEQVVAGIETIKLSDHMIKGAVYTLPDFDLAEVSVKADGGEKVKINDAKYKVEAENTLEFFYETENKTLTHNAAVVDVGYGQNLFMNKFFAVETGNTEITSGDSSCSFGFSEPVSVKFINFVDVSDFMIEFDLFTENVNYGKVDFILEDIVTKKSVAVNYTKTTKSWSATAGGITKKLSASSDGYSIGFNCKDGRLVYNERTFITVNSYADGTNYAGFTDNKAILYIVFDGVTNDSDFELFSINKQSFANIGKDFNPPKIVVDTVSTSGYYEDVFILNGGYAIDVIDPDVSFTLTVTDKNGNYVNSTVGETLNKCDANKDYGFILDSYGMFTVIYEATDFGGKGKLQRFTAQIEVIDDIKPEITLTGKITEGRIGERIAVAQAVYSDNVTSAEDILTEIYIMGPSLSVTKITDGFTPERSGIYTVMFMAIDEMFNVTVESYRVEVQ